jgi:hypothetical protein
VEARDKNGRIGGCVLAKGKEAFPDSHHPSTTQWPPTGCDF